MTPEIVSTAESLFDNGEWILGIFRSFKPEFEKRPYLELEDSKMLV
jgi:hypothetical protein